MEWKNLTVKQFQDLQKLLFESRELDEVDVDFEMFCICYGLTHDQANSLELEKYRDMIQALSFIHTEKMNFEPVKHVDLPSGIRYKFIYDIKKIRAHRYLEVRTFEANGGVVNNLHRIAASMSIRQRKNFWGIWVDVEYDSADHEEYANELLDCPITEIYGSVVFFCKVYAETMKSSKDYLITEMTKTMGKEKALEAYTHLCAGMDGFSKQL